MKIATIMILSSLLLPGCAGNDNNTSSSIEEWDIDNDTRLDSEEFGRSFDVSKTYESWDQNKDNRVEEMEWGNGVKQNSEYDPGRHGRYRDWDADGDSNIDKDELSKRTFSMYDVDGDGYIESKEYERWYYGAHKRDDQ